MPPMTQPMTDTTPRRAVMWQIPPEIEAWRKRTGADRHDEVWDGVIHMSPSPTGKHQGLGGEIHAWILRSWQARRQGRVFYERNVARPGLPDWREDYRSPDLVLVKPERFGRDVDTHFEGGPDIVVEIYTPGDESYDKLAFYFEIDVEEVWVVHRDTKVPELFVRREKGFEPARPDADGWLASAATGIAMRSVPGDRLALRRLDDHATEAVVPADW